MPTAPDLPAFAQRPSSALEVAKAAAISHPYLTTISFVFGAYLTYSYLAYARLRHFPGPKLAGWTRIPLILWHMGGRVHLKFQEINETYGSIAVIAPGVLLTSDPELMRRMAAPKSRYKRNVWYMAFRFNPDKDHIGCERDNGAHSQMKLKLAPGVSYP